MNKAACMLVISLMVATTVLAAPNKQGNPFDERDWGDQRARGHDVPEHVYGEDRWLDPEPDAVPQREALRAADFVIARISDEDRAIIRSYLREDYRKNCPPGSDTRKHQGCLPPDHVRHYKIGSSVSEAFKAQALPSALAAAISTPPAGTAYTMLDGDVVLISQARGIVLDAVMVETAVE
ncbi:MAG: hypothetical protein AB7G06_06780 [Bdellovibrionales bacterium]